MVRRLVDAAGTANAQQVFLNGSPIPVSGFQEYTRLFGTGASVYARLSSQWEVCVTLSEEGAGFQSVSFVNGIHTHKGGTHVNAFVDALCKKMAPLLAKQLPAGVCPVSTAVTACGPCLPCEL